MVKGFIIALILVGGVLAQAPLAAPTLSATEAAAIDNIKAKQIELQREFAQIDNEFRKNHPGWHLSGATLQPEQDAKPEVKQEKKP